MTKGRKPLPTAIKKLMNNPGGRPLNENEPKPEIKAPDCPEWIANDKLAKEEWDRITVELLNVDILCEMDHALLEAYCIAYSRWVAAEKKVLEKGTLSITGQKVTTKTKRDGTIEETKSGGNVITSPYLWVSNKAFEQMRKIGAELGLSPSARSRIKVNNPKKKDKGWGDL